MMSDGAIVGGIISKIINDLTDVSRSKIEKAIVDKKNKYKSFESQIYNIIFSVLKELYDNSYDRNSDKIYDTAEKLLKGFIEYGKEDEDAVRYALKNILSCVDDDKCIEFKRLLIHEISKEEYNELYREIRLLQEEKEYRKTNSIEQKVDHLGQKLDDIRKKDERIIRNTDKAEKFQNNKKQDYIDNWNSRLFLHIDNDERPLTLADAFIMPDFRCQIHVESIKFSDKDTLDEVINKFIKYNRSSNMLITGMPGIGKTSIVSWMANEYKENDNVIILRFRDWERNDFNNGLFSAIRYTLDCIKWDLENKIIILDGFDEIKVLDDGEVLIKDFLNDVLDFKNVKVIVTSRKDYIEDHLFQNAFSLLPFRIDDIKQFYYIITGNELNNDLDISNLDVLGIPVILYMAIMSNIDVTKEATKPELYSKIFAEKGGIFDRFSYGGDGYDYGNQILRDSKNIRSYLKFLQEIAFKMFDENKLSIPRNEDEIPNLTFQGAEISVLEFPIKHFFDNTISNIEFVHNSIFEYFVSEYIIKNMYSVIDLDVSSEELAGFFGKKLINGKLSIEIIDYMKYKIKTGKLNKEFGRVNNAFQLMLQDGMTYYTRESWKNVIKCEINIFANMLEIIHLWENKFLKYNKYYFYFINHKESIELNLSFIDFSGKNLENINLSNTNLSYANFKDANLKNANLRGANLENAVLIGASLEGAAIDGVRMFGIKAKVKELFGAVYEGNKLDRDFFKWINVEAEF